MSRPRSLTRSALRSFPLPPIEDGGKDSKGRVLVIAGSRRLPGAVILVANAAMRAGAGKVRVATVESAAVAIGVAVPEAMAIGLPEARDGGFTRAAITTIREQADGADVVVAGPGMARSKSCAAIAEALLDGPAPLIFDAAMLHSLPQRASRSGATPILLPHSGELAALLDRAEKEIDRDPVGCGLRAAERHRAIVLVKGATSHVVAPDGSAWTYRGGASGLGVSGSGDVLAGIVGGLSARGADPLTALLWGVLLHGEAGEALAKRIGPIGFLAREIADEIPALPRR